MKVQTSYKNNSKAIVTLVIGHKYRERWEKICKNNWLEYADKHGYDLICIDTPLDESERARQRSAAWQKCLILSQNFSKEYEQIVWIDSDILINSSFSPCIVKDVPIEKVGAVEVYGIPTPHIYLQTLQRQYDYWGQEAIINLTAQQYYENYGLPPIFDKVVQTGVLVLSPNYHRQILEKVYYEYEEKGGGNWNYEMRPLSWEMLKIDSVHWIDQRFNAIWMDLKALNYPFLLEKQKYESRIIRKFNSVLGINYPPKKYTRSCATTAFINNFFLHFAGCIDDMKLVDLEATSWQNCKLY